MDAAAGRGFVAAVSYEDHLNLLKFVRNIDAERSRDQDRIWKSKLAYRLRLGHSLVTCDYMHRPSDLGRAKPGKSVGLCGRL